MAKPKLSRQVNFRLDPDVYANFCLVCLSTNPVLAPSEVLRQFMSSWVPTNRVHRVVDPASFRQILSTAAIDPATSLPIGQALLFDS